MISKEAVWRKRHKAMQMYCCLMDMGAKCQHMALDRQYGSALSKLDEGVGLLSRLMWTTVMAATVRHQIVVAVYRCSSVGGCWEMALVGDVASSPVYLCTVKKVNKKD